MKKFLVLNNVLWAAFFAAVMYELLEWRHLAVRWESIAKTWETAALQWKKNAHEWREIVQPGASDEDEKPIYH